MSQPIEFDDIFALDPASEERLGRIVSDVAFAERGPAFEFRPDADKDQQRFIESKADTIRLLAPAGSGKTQSIINRVLHRASQGERLDRFLILTFDNAATLSLRQRLDSGIKALGLVETRVPKITTLNAFGSQLLRGPLAEYCGNLRLGAEPESDRHESIRRALDELRRVNPRVMELLPRKLARRVYLDFIAALKNNILTPSALFSREDHSAREAFFDICRQRRLLEPWFVPLDGRPDIDSARKQVINALLHLYKLYDEIMRHNGHLDFDDQKLLPYLALRGNHAAASAAMSRFAHVVVDEFQDINRLDFELIRTLTGDRALVVVGDDDQAIYAFRGCSPDFILNFENHAGRSAETHILTVNYRSPRNIVEMSTRGSRARPHRIRGTSRRRARL